MTNFFAQYCLDDTAQTIINNSVFVATSSPFSAAIIGLKFTTQIAAKDRAEGQEKSQLKKKGLTIVDICGGGDDKMFMKLYRKGLIRRRRSSSKAQGKIYVRQVFRHQYHRCYFIRPVTFWRVSIYRFFYKSFQTQISAVVSPCKGHWWQVSLSHKAKDLPFRR